MQVTSEEAKVSQSWKQNLLLREILSEGTEDLIELHDCSNLSSTVLNTKFENAHLFLSQYAGNLHTNYLGSQIILKGSSYFLAILLRVQRRILRKGKHSGRCDCTLSNTICFNHLIFWTWSSPWFQDISDFKLAIGQSHSDWSLLTRNAELKSYNVTHSRLY